MDIFDISNDNSSLAAELYDLLYFSDDLENYDDDDLIEVSSKKKGKYNDFMDDNLNNDNYIMINKDENLLDLNNINQVFIYTKENQNKDLYYLPKYKDMNFHVVSEVPYGIEKLFSVGNFQSMNNLLALHCDKTCGVHIIDEQLNFTGYQSFVYFLKTLLATKPDLITKLDKTQMKDNIMENKFYSKSSDSEVLNQLIIANMKKEKALDFNPNSNMILDSHNQDNITNNSDIEDDAFLIRKVTEYRTERILSKLLLDPKHKKKRMNVIKDLLNSNQDVSLHYVNHMNLTIDPNTHKITNIYFRTYITNVSSIS